jgi:hypothetical protein
LSRFAIRTKECGAEVGWRPGKCDYVKVGPRLANGMRMVIPKDKRNHDLNPDAYPKRGHHYKGCNIKLEIHQFQMIAKLRAYVKLGIADKTINDAWNTFMNGDFCEDWYDVSHLTGMKRDMNPFNMIAEKNKPNIRRKKCTSRCNCKCGNDTMCLSHCGNSKCKSCNYRVDKPSKGYPEIQRFLDKLDEQSDDVFMQFVKSFCI